MLRASSEGDHDPMKQCTGHMTPTAGPLSATTSCAFCENPLLSETDNIKMYSSSCSFFIVISPLWSIDQTVCLEGGEGHCIEIPQIDFAQALIHNQSTSNIEPSCPLPTFATSLILAKYLMVLKSFQGNKQYVWRSLTTLKWHRDLDLVLQANIPLDCQAPGRHTKSSRIPVKYRTILPNTWLETKKQWKITC